MTTISASTFTELVGEIAAPDPKWLNQARSHLDNLTKPLGSLGRLEDIAAQAMMSTRTLSRRFREQTGTTPLQWLNRARLRKAQCLLETTGHSVEWIASHVGFGSSTTFRDQFKHLVGISPQAYRRAFRGTATIL